MSDLPPPPHPYRGAAILHGVLAVAILVVAELTGGDPARAALAAAAYFILATGWSWLRFRQRASRLRRATPRTSNGDGSS